MGPPKDSGPSAGSRALALGAPEGPWALRAPYTKGPQGPQRGPGPLVSGALTWGPWGPTPLADSRKKKSSIVVNDNGI